MKQKNTGEFGDEICRGMAAVRSVLKKIGSSSQNLEVAICSALP
jgi:hypothetical protein